jgi:hypothetical protein
MHMKESILFEPPTSHGRFPFRTRRVLLELSQRKLTAQAGVSKWNLRRPGHTHDTPETLGPTSTGRGGASQPKRES